VFLGFTTKSAETWRKWSDPTGERNGHV